METWDIQYLQDTRKWATKISSISRIPDNSKTGFPVCPALQINNSTYYFSNILFGPDELQVYDATTLRLQEISLGYNIPKKYLDKTPFGSVNLAVSGFNLWYKAFNVPEGTNFDPNVAGTGIGAGQGFDYLNGPSSKRYGFSIKATF